MNHHTFTIPGDPKGWARAGKSGKQHFTPAAQTAYQNTVRWIAKAILDALKSIAWGDDVQVVNLNVIKLWTDADARVEVSIRSYAAELGITKGAVCGALHRLGLTNKREPAQTRERPRYTGPVCQKISIPPVARPNGRALKPRPITDAVLTYPMDKRAPEVAAEVGCSIQQVYVARREAIAGPAPITRPKAEPFAPRRPQRFETCIHVSLSNGQLVACGEPTHGAQRCEAHRRGTGGQFSYAGLKSLNFSA